MTRKRAPRANTFPFLVSGPVPGFLNEIHEWTSAVSEAQALKQVEKRLEKKYPDIKIYLGGCTAIRHERKSKEEKPVREAAATRER